MAVLDDVKKGTILQESERKTIDKVDRFVSLSPELSRVSSPEILSQLQSKNPQLKGISFDELAFYNSYRLQKATELTPIGTPAKTPSIWSSVSSTFTTGRGKPTSGSLSTSDTRNLKENSIADRWGALLKGQYGEKIAGIKNEGEFLKWRDSLPELEKTKYPRTMWKFKKYYDVSQWRKLVRSHPQLQKLEKYASLSQTDPSPEAQALRLQAFQELKKIQTDVQNADSGRTAMSRYMTPTMKIPDNALELLGSLDKTVAIPVKPGSLPLGNLSQKQAVTWKDGQQQLSPRALSMLGKTSILIKDGRQVLTPEMETFKKKREGKEQRLVQAKHLRHERRAIRREVVGIAHIQKTQIDPLLKKTAINYKGGYALKRARELYLKQKQERIAAQAQRTDAIRQAQMQAEQEHEQASKEESAYSSILNTAQSQSEESNQQSPSSSSSSSNSSPLSQHTNNWSNNKLQGRLGNIRQQGANKLAQSNNNLLRNLGSKLGGLGAGGGAATGTTAATTGAGTAIATSEIWVPIAIVVGIIVFIIVLIIIIVILVPEVNRSMNPVAILLNKSVDKSQIANPTDENTENLTYTLTASYPASASSIFITDIIPDNAEFVSAEGKYTAYDASGNTITDTETNKGDIKKVVWNVTSSTTPTASTSATSSVIPSGWPTSGKVTQGPRGPFDHEALFVAGIEAVDIAGNQGTPIYATFDAVVKTADDSCGTCNGGGFSYGNYVILTDDERTFDVFYGHMVTVKVKTGQAVKRGDVIGYMGNTGYSIGNHTHYEFRGLKLAPPNIPQPITPLNCDKTACSPATVSFQP